jgi:hypothetical protein
MKMNRGEAKRAWATTNQLWHKHLMQLLAVPSLK